MFRGNLIQILVSCHLHSVPSLLMRRGLVLVVLLVLLPLLPLLCSSLGCRNNSPKKASHQNTHSCIPLILIALNNIRLPTSPEYVPSHY